MNKEAAAAHKQLENLDRLQRADHDILIELRTNITTLVEDVKEIKDGTTRRITANSQRIDTLEDEMLSAYTILRTLKWIIGALVATIAFIIATLSGIFDLLGH